MTRFSPEACVSLVLAALLLAGCDRPLVNPIAPDIEVVSPDLDAIQAEDDVRLQLSVASISGVDQVRVNGAEAALDEETGLWEIDVMLRPGANTFVLEASSNEATATREVDIIQASIDVRAAGSVLPEARAGHTATALVGGLLIAGGTGPDGGVLGTARVLRETGATFSVEAPIDLQVPRTGHTATALPDGRVLLLGGTSTPEASGVSSFVTTPEIYDPVSGMTRPVFTRRSQSRRTNHTTVLLTREGRTYLYALGGIAPTGSTTSSASGTLDIFEFKSTSTADTLVTFTPGGGAGAGAALPDATQLVLTTSPTQVVTVLTGFEAPGDLPFASRLFYTAPGSQYPFDLTSGAAELPLRARTAASGVGLSNSLALLVGGRGTGGAPLASMEVFADRAGRFLSVPATLATPRYRHTVTRAPSGRILVIGGRDARSQALSTVEVLTL